MISPLLPSASLLERPGPQSRLLVLLHGYGLSPDGLVDRLHLIDPDGTFLTVVPTAPFTHKGLAVWHRAWNAPDEAQRQYLASLAALDDLLGDVEHKVGLPAADAVVGGFSQGGGLALGLLLGVDVAHRPAATFGVCSFPPNVDGFRVRRAGAADRPFFLSSARQDRFAPIEVSRRGAAFLRETGLDVTYVETPGEHEMTDEAAAHVGRWLATLARGDRWEGDDLLADVPGRNAHYEGKWVFLT